MSKYAPWPSEGKLLIIEMTGCLLVLGEGEMLALLAHEPGIWESALKRGKAYKRSRERMAGRQAGGGNPSVIEGRP